MRKMTGMKIRITALLLAVLCAALFTACGADNAGGSSESRWTMTIGGNKVTLPCTMAELEEMGIHLYTEYDEETIYESQNQTFTMICAVHEDAEDLMYLKIVTGDKPEDGSANAQVCAITNMTLDTDAFHMNKKFGLGASIDDMIAAFGEDYVVAGAAGDDIQIGYTVINYGTGSDNIIFIFDDNELKSMEVQYYEGE